MVRRILVVAHRYAGLAMAAFLVLIGLTGSVLAFLPELERTIAPELFAPVRSGDPLDAAALIVRAEVLEPRARVTSVSLRQEDTAILSVIPRMDPVSGRPFALDFTQIFLDPYTGRELARRTYGNLSQGRINLMPFIYLLHQNLAWRGTGSTVLGVVALIWTLDCFVGLYLTFPPRRRARGRSLTAGSAWWHRWRPSWLVKWGGSPFRMNFHLHRAGGLWVWLPVLVFAWSSVYLNLYDVYAPVTRLVLDYPLVNNHHSEELTTPVPDPTMTWREAQEASERFLAEEARTSGITKRFLESFSYSASSGTYAYRLSSSRDFQDRGGRTYVILDGNTGGLREFRLPNGQHSGATFTNWIYALHMANVFGTPFRIFVFVCGLIITMLSVTGVYVWWKKRGFRKHVDARLADSRTGAAAGVPASAILTSGSGR